MQFENENKGTIGLLLTSTLISHTPKSIAEAYIIIIKNQIKRAIDLELCQRTSSTANQLHSK